jgi:hypothetical protein
VIDSELPSVPHLQWSPPDPATVHWVDPSSGDRYTRTDALPPLPLVGLPAGHPVELQVHTATGHGELDHTVAAAPALLDDLTVLADDDAQASDGLLLANVYLRREQQGYLAAFDGHGRLRWWQPSPHGRKPIRARLHGDEVLWGVTGWSQEEGMGLLGSTRLDGTATTEVAAPGLHHEVVPTDDGWLYLAYEVDPETSIGLLPGQPTAADVLRTVDPSDGTLVDGFSYFDDYPLAPYSPCNHAQLPSFFPGVVEFTHTNSLVPFDDGWLLLPRYLDALVFVRDDRFVWQAGGRGGTLVAGSDDAEVLHGHFTEAFGDRALVFDNGSHGDRASRVVELQLLPDEGRYDAVWWAEHPDGDYIDFLGDARRLPGGHTLVAWSPQGRVDELRDDGSVAWSLQLHTPDVVIGRIEWHPELPGAWPRSGG